MKKNISIGLDFDGVIADYQLLKSLVAKELFNKEIPPELMSSRALKEHPLLTPEEYRTAQKEALLGSHPDLLHALPGAIETIKKLQEKGCELQIITSRTDEGLEAARSWLLSFNISMKMTGVGYGESKLPYMKGLDAYIDDGPEVLAKIQDVSTKLFLFNPQNEKISGNFQSVKSWSEFFDSLPLN